MLRASLKPPRVTLVAKLVANRPPVLNDAVVNDAAKADAWARVMSWSLALPTQINRLQKAQRDSWEISKSRRGSGEYNQE
jgi:hypothetical protein